MDEHGHDHHHGPLPSSGRALDGVAMSATLHCLSGCALGEVAGMIVGTALGLSNLATIVISIVLAFAFGYSLTSLPLLRAGLTLAAVAPVALASDTFSIATMEVVDNVVMVVIPGALHAGLGDLLFWGSLSFSLVVAGLAAFPVNRFLLARGKGHAAVHETGIHGGPPIPWVATAASVAAVFGVTVLAVEAFTNDDAHAGGHEGHGAMAGDGVPGLAVTGDGLALHVERTDLPRGRRADLRFRIAGRDGRPVTAFQVEHDRRLHLIVVRRDGQDFQHLHPRMSADGTWSMPVELPEAGSYRMFADFKTGDRTHTLGADLFVDGATDWRDLKAPANVADAGDGYRVSLAGGGSHLRFQVTLDGEPVRVEPYLGANGHLVALRQGDLAYLHVHPLSHGAMGGHGDHGSMGDHAAPGGDAIDFEAEFPSAGRYALYLQFKHEGRVHTAQFTRDVGGHATP